MAVGRKPFQKCLHVTDSLLTVLIDILLDVDPQPRSIELRINPAVHMFDGLGDEFVLHRILQGLELEEFAGGGTETRCEARCACDG